MQDLITDAHAARMLVHVLNGYTAQLKDVRTREYWESVTEDANACLSAQSTFLDLIDCLAYKLRPTKGANSLQRQYAKKMQAPNEDPVTFLNRMRSDAVVISDSMSEAQCVSTFIANLQDTAYATRLQEHQQKGECESWDQARDLIDDMTRRNFASASTQVRYWSMDLGTEEVRTVNMNEHSSISKTEQDRASEAAERLEQFLLQHPALLPLKDTLHKRCWKCLKKRDHISKYCKLAGKKVKCHICGQSNHDGDSCSKKATPKEQWYCNLPYYEDAVQQTNTKPSATSQDKPKWKGNGKVWGQLRALNDLVHDKYKNPHVLERLQKYFDEGKMTQEQVEKYQTAVNEYNNF